jgi:hypothetical protein
MTGVQDAAAFGFFHLHKDTHYRHWGILGRPQVDEKAAARLIAAL